MNIDNCPRCGKIFAKGFRDVCPACVREIDKEYETCANYLRENRGASITELSEETGVSIRQITKFIREGRISLMDAPNLSYPCESCGVLIQSNNLCDSCRNRLVNASKNLFSNESLAQEKKLSEEEVKEVYKGINQYKDR
ncbi:MULTISPECIES: TIGR03826 family flagellar region protein [Paenibacillus]|uniref:TIGR03826 family flagellar region protein n=1 Tax=Paenibacillus TaxID=44249 RepID=UPI00203F2EEC|nr:TIGR03826 family flagellar region protein [Paenibacillus camelliae]MCM3635961.1 flagellar protein [Paenibacillus camelliae]